MFKVNNKTPERRQWHCSGVSIVNFEQVNVGYFKYATPAQNVYAKPIRPFVNPWNINPLMHNAPKWSDTPY